MKTFYVLRCLAVGAAVLSGLSKDASSAPIISAGSVWRYWDAGTDPGPTWATPGFNDSAWMSGPGQLGFGDGDEATLLQRGIVTAYFRQSFSVADVAAVSNLTVRVLRDDGVAVYLNGIEVFRNNLPPGSLSYNTLATIAAPDENAYLEVPVPSALLVAGQNAIAAEVHQVNVTSSDLGFDLELRADGTSPPDPELPVVTVAAVDGSASEQGPESGQFRLTRAGATNETLHVSLHFSGTAGNGVDCSLLPAAVDIPAGVVSVELTVQPIDDALVEGTETLVLELEPPACLNQTPPGPGCYRVGIGQATVEILDNDTPPNTGPVALIRSNSVWKYLDDGTDQGSAWRTPGFDDSTWASGAGQLGYGDGDEATVVSFGPDPANKFVTTYFRRSFEVAHAAGVSNLVMHVLRDDGVAVYLNGVEVLRHHLPAGPIDFHTLATAVAADENVYVPVAIPSSALVSGRNVIAAEVHQVNVVSSDLGFDLALFASGIVGTLDADGDGVPNESDQCAGTPAGAMVDGHGCSLSQLCPCDAGWANHGDYVQCVLTHAWEFFRAGLISDEQRREIIRTAARSDCGHSPGVAERLRVHLVPRTPTECQREGLGIVVTGDASGSCAIETSTDLKTWTLLRAMDEDEMGAEVSCPHTTGEASRFFRVRIAP